MKKLFTTMLTVLASGAAFALPVGNPSEASLLCDGICWEGHCGDVCDPCLTWCDAFSVRVGFYGDYVFQRNLKMQNNLSSGTYQNIDQSTIFTNAGYIALNFWDRLDFFATLGASDWSLGGNTSSFNGTAGFWEEVYSAPVFSWSVGTRGTLWECGCTAIGAEFQYFQFRAPIQGVVISPQYFNDATVASTSRYYEWQVGLGISHRIHCFVPYIAVKWSGAQLQLHNATNTGTNSASILTKAKTAHLWGYAVGVSLIDCEKAAITGEVRLGDESAAYINGQVRF
ncbi:MAG: hypothetical protein JSS62_05470 [Verrucomicrobia bacterium]|nr:hypothetical protein [Verrucomicrobiota bacterium]MBS0646350.1 hypothetical protein [Verrucomicrobiota bacterium]